MNFLGTEVGEVAVVQVEAVVLEEVIREEAMATPVEAVVGIWQVEITDDLEHAN